MTKRHPNVGSTLKSLFEETGESREVDLLALKKACRSLGVPVPRTGEPADLGLAWERLALALKKAGRKLG